MPLPERPAGDFAHDSEHFREHVVERFSSTRQRVKACLEFIRFPGQLHIGKRGYVRLKRIDPINNRLICFESLFAFVAENLPYHRHRFPIVAQNKNPPNWGIFVKVR